MTLQTGKKGKPPSVGALEVLVQISVKCIVEEFWSERRQAPLAGGDEL